MGQKLYEEKTITSNGSLMRLIKIDNQWKLHNWDGPAVTPIDENSKTKGSYYLYGNELSLKEWKAVLKNREGLPWYKSSSTKSRS